MKKDEIIEIDGHTYTIRCMTTSVGSRVLVQMFRILAPASKVLSIFDIKPEIENLMDKPIEIEAIAKGLMERLQEDEVMALVEKVLEPIQVKHGDEKASQFVDLKPLYEQHFAGRYDSLFQVFFVALKHNYAAFFLGVPGLVKNGLSLMMGSKGPRS